MALENKSFSKIVINDDDDDFVIQAGVSAPSSPEEDYSVSGSTQYTNGQDSLIASEKSLEIATDAKSVFVRELPNEDCSQEEGTASTSLEDELSVPPMSGMQKAIIVLAVLLFGIAIAYLIIMSAR